MEYLIALSKLFIGAFEVYIYYDFLKSVFPFKDDRFSRRMGKVALLVTTNYLINSFQSPTINLISIPLSYLLFCFLLYEASIKQRIFYVLFLYTLFACGEVVFEIFKMQLDLPNYELTNLFLILFQKILMFMIFKIIQLIPRKKIEQEQHKSLLYTYFIFPLSSFIIFDGILNFDFGSNTPMFQKVLLGFGGLLLLFSNSLIFFLFEKLSDMMSRTRELDLLTMKSNMENKHYERLERINLEHATYLHDINKYLRTIGYLAEQNDNSDILKILDEMNVQVYNIEAKSFSDHPILNAILYDRSIQAAERNIEFHAFVEPNLNLDKIEDIDLISMVGNLLDNAIEAADQCMQERMVNAKLYMGNDAFIVLEVENSFLITPEKIGNRFISKKKNKEKHGFGVLRVQELAAKYGGMLRMNHSETLFTVTLVLSAIG